MELMEVCTSSNFKLMKSYSSHAAISQGFLLFCLIQVGFFFAGQTVEDISLEMMQNQWRERAGGFFSSSSTIFLQQENSPQALFLLLLALLRVLPNWSFSSHHRVCTILQQEKSPQTPFLLSLALSRILPIWTVLNTARNPPFVSNS